MQTIQVIINTILAIWTSVKSLMFFFKEKKVEKIQIEELKKEEENVTKKVESAVSQKNLDKLNELAGWKD